MSFEVQNSIQTNKIKNISESEGFYTRRHWNEPSVDYALNYHKDILEDKLKDSKTFLDIGCGRGELVRSVKDFYPHLDCYGIDLIKNFNVRISDKMVDLKQGDAHFLPFEDESMDVVISIYAMPYMTDKLKVIEEAYRVLKQDGLGVLSIYDHYFKPDGREIIPESDEESDVYWDRHKTNIILNKKGKGFFPYFWRFKGTIKHMSNLHLTDSVGSVYERLI
ncbi:class I SAM-dependent methyltransferase [Candidatus Woesearchaeota archaeon]|nr:class I SAM-dependent methyltransferase [Candidatus Woesearchaeota archaeon]